MNITHLLFQISTIVPSTTRRLLLPLALVHTAVLQTANHAHAHHPQQPEPAVQRLYNGILGPSLERIAEVAWAEKRCGAVVFGGGFGGD